VEIFYRNGKRYFANVTAKGLITAPDIRTSAKDHSRRQPYSGSTAIFKQSFGFPPGDGALFGAGVQGDLGAFAGHPEVGVLDVDGDDLPGVGGSDAQPLAGDHDDAVAGNLGLHADRAGSWRRQRCCGGINAFGVLTPTHCQITGEKKNVSRAQIRPARSRVKKSANRTCTSSPLAIVPSNSPTVATFRPSDRSSEIV
jgi:hypothetical protein